MICLDVSKKLGEKNISHILDKKAGEIWPLDSELGEYPGLKDIN